MESSDLYLWTLKIQQLPFGAEGTIIEAIHNYPKGKTILLPPAEWNGQQEEFFFDPIGFKTKLIDRFQETAHQATAIFEGQLPFQEKANQLIKLDAKLYTILYFYLNEQHDASTLDSSDIETRLDDIHLYFDPSKAEQFNWLDTITPLKFLKL